MNQFVEGGGREVMSLLNGALTYLDFLSFLLNYFILFWSLSYDIKKGEHRSVPSPKWCSLLAYHFDVNVHVFSAII